MSRDEQEQKRRDARRLCQAQYRRGDYPQFLNARCKREQDHDGYHRTWRRSQRSGDPYEKQILEWEQDAVGG